MEKHWFERCQRGKTLTSAHSQMLRPLDLVLSTFIDGETQGREAVLDVLKRAQAGGMYSRTIEWKKIDADATPMRVEAVQPASAFPAGFTWDLSFNDA